MTIKPETSQNIDEEDVLLDDDVEALRKRLSDLSEQGEIKTTKTFLSNKKKATEKVMKKILGEYLEKKDRQAKMEMSIALVSLFPNLIEKFGMIKFKDGSAIFSQKIIEDENTMFCIVDLMPSCQGGDTCFKYLSASIFLGTLIWNNVVWSKDEKKSGQTKSKTPQDTGDDEGVKVSSK